MTLLKERRSKSTSELRIPRKSQHEFRRKTILTRSPIFRCRKSQNDKFDPKFEAAIYKSPSSNPDKCHSLPRKYKHAIFSQHPDHSKLHHSLSQGPKVEPQEFKRRLETLKSWIEEFSDDQRTLLISSIFPHLGASQLHFLSSQLPEHNPGLHHLCPSGCSDPMSLLPPPISLDILSRLSPTDLATTTRVCSTWRQLALTSSLWQSLCR